MPEAVEWAVGPMHNKAFRVIQGTPEHAYNPSLNLPCPGRGMSTDDLAGS